jgi:heptosyltransferase-1
MRLLLIRTSALGDIVHCLPALRALRSALPEATIGWVVEKSFLPLLERDPDLDHVFPVELRPWRRRLHRPTTWREMAGALGAVRSFGADVALDLMGNHKAGALGLVSGAGRRIGLHRSDRREPSSTLWMSQTVPAGGVHAVDRALSVAAALVGDAPYEGFGADRIRLAAGDEAPPSTDDYIVIHPGAAWPNKCYPPEGWGAVATRLAAETGWPVLLSLGPGEQELGAAVVAASEGAGQPAPGRGLASLVALLAGASLVVGGDTGPTHLAFALGRPTLFVHGPTDPATHGPYLQSEKAIFHRLPCSFCHRRFDGVQRCLTELGPESIAARALGLIDV